MPNENSRQIRNYFNYMERKLVEEILELEQFMEIQYKTLETYKRMCLENSHNDDEFESLREWAQDEIDEPMCADDVKEMYEELFNEYYSELSETLSKINTFEEAEECSYLREKDTDYKHFILNGLDLEKLISKLKEFRKDFI